MPDGVHSGPRSGAPPTIAFVLPSFAGGGAERVILTLIARLDRTRFHPHLIVLDAHGPLASCVPADIPVITLGHGRLRSALPALARALHRLRPAAVVATIGYLNLGVLALRPVLPARTRIIVREANLPLPALRGLPTSAPARWLYRRLYRRADAVVCPAEAVAEAMIREHRISPHQIHVVYSPVDVAAVRAAAVPIERAPGAGPRLVAAGRLHRQKGFDRLLPLCGELPPDARLCIMGEGPAREELAGQARRLGVADRVGFPGFRSDPWRLIAGADAFLLPSRWEGMPNVALEALALGVPVIATPEAGGIVEVAALAPAGAVTIAAAGPSFAAAMASVRPSPPTGLRASLLPVAFQIEPAVRRFEALLDAVT